MQRHKVAKNREAKIAEVFSSIQGEGPYLGIRQIFVRFVGCNMRCAYCDTETDSSATSITASHLIKNVMYLEKKHGPHHSVSITGGEPLLHAGFLGYFLPALKKQNFKIYLETNGTLTKELKGIIHYIDIISMDVKLPSSTRGKGLWGSHRDFLRTAIGKDIFVKTIVTKKTSNSDVRKARDLVNSIDKNVTFIIQPQGIGDRGESDIPRKRLLFYSDLARKTLNDVRIIPQTHKILNLR
ncbi:MAG: 7-carboxy-7-deazaguanine synthase QueE [Candidatus Omnitrophica bacterium]|nr:7-carboxy-7-deazaguanine synthase QueE [Candidatus Omnitrophota bacterium]